MLNVGGHFLPTFHIFKIRKLVKYLQKLRKITYPMMMMKKVKRIGREIENPKEFEK